MGENIWKKDPENALTHHRGYSEGGGQKAGQQRHLF